MHIQETCRGDMLLGIDREGRLHWRLSVLGVIVEDDSDLLNEVLVS